MRTQVTETRCDLCGYGSTWTDPSNFITIGTVDLCKWCACPDRMEWIESGGHRATFGEGESWTCSCGAKSPRDLVILPRIREAIPVLANATAHLHMSTSPVVTS